MPTIIDNQETELGPFLREILEKGVALDACVGYLNLRGWEHLAETIDELKGVDGRPPARVLVGMAARDSQLIHDQYKVRDPNDNGRVTNVDVPRIREEVLKGLRHQLLFGMPNNHEEAVLRRFREQLESGRVSIKLFTRYPLHAKLYLAHLLDDQVIPSLGVVGSSNLTSAGLGRQGELNVDVTDKDPNEKLQEWFEDRWSDELAVDVTEDLIALLDESWVSPDQPQPFLVYLKLAYELSRDAREGLRDFDIPPIFEDRLLDHQVAAVKVASRIVEHRGGVIIGDVVGLGKTLVATAIAKLLAEQENAETLVVCPKNLIEMWEEHLSDYEVRHKVVSLSMVHSELEELRRYRLLIIDESHNFRNTDTRQWKALHSYIEQNEPKVVMLTATPYNKDYLDASGQLRLWKAPEDDLGIRPERKISDDGEAEVARRADGQLSSLRAFETSDHSEDWQRLMSLFLVRRTRRFIEEQYGKKDPDGRVFLTFPDGTPFYFPERIPCPLEYQGGAADPGDRLASPEVVDQINELKLPRYRLGEYLELDEGVMTAEQEEVVKRLERSPANLLGFIRTTLLKRLSSCGDSFLASIERHLLRNQVILFALDQGEDVPIGTLGDRRWEEIDDLGDLDLDGLDSNVGEPIGRSQQEWMALAGNRYLELKQTSPARIRWLPAEFFGEQLRNLLMEDNELLQGILNEHGPWDPEKDTKIDALTQLIAKNHPGEKVLIFSEYADTADYVFRELGARLPDVPLAVATGDTESPTRLARRFSPRSNRSIGGLPKGEGELQVLIATDVLSEGQNLQDSAIVVNYDLPWTIIKLIQRAGRVDRVGQEEPEVLVYSFLPQHGVEAVIDLRRRIRDRLREAAEVFGSDERFFEDDLTEELEDLFDGKVSLQDLETETEDDVDWASQALAIWEAAPADLREAARVLPDVTYSTRPRRADETQPSGCLVYTRTDAGIEGLAFTTPGSGPDPNTEMLTPLEALARARVQQGVPAVGRRDDHHDLVAWAVQHVLWKAARQPMALPTAGPRKRLYSRLSDYQEMHKGTLTDTPELRDLIERVLKNPLRETAKHRVVRAMRNQDLDGVVALAIDLNEQNELLVDLDTEEDDLRIVCSLGVADEG